MADKSEIPADHDDSDKAHVSSGGAAGAGGNAGAGAGNGGDDGASGDAGAGAGNGGDDGASGDARAGAVVNLDDLTNQEIPTKSARIVTPPLVRVGLRLAVCVFALICACTIAIFIIAFGYTHTVEPPGRLYYFDQASLDRYQRAVELYKQIGDVPLQRAKELFQLVVITAFLPSFTAILGYIFGTRGGGNSNPPNN